MLLYWFEMWEQRYVMVLIWNVRTEICDEMRCFHIRAVISRPSEIHIITFFNGNNVTTVVFVGNETKRPCDCLQNADYLRLGFGVNETWIATGGCSSSRRLNTGCWFFRVAEFAFFCTVRWNMLTRRFLLTNRTCKHYTTRVCMCVCVDCCRTQKTGVVFLCLLS